MIARTGAQADTVVGDAAVPFESEETALDAYAGVAAYSVPDTTGTGYRIAVTRHGGAPQVLPVAAQPRPFDLDIGPGPAGRPALVYSRCSSSQPVFGGTGCDLFLVDLDRGTEAPIANANTPTLDERTPSIWRDQVAFSRERPGRQGTGRVYTVAVRGPATPERRPGVPTRRCFDKVCRTVTVGRFHDLELRAGWLAMVAEVGPGSYDNPDVELRLDPPTGTPRRIARVGVGAIAVRRTFLGLGLTADALTFTRINYYAGDDFFRYDLAHRTYRSASLGRHTYGVGRRDATHLYRLGRCGTACATAPFDPLGPFVPLKLRLSIIDSPALRPARSPVYPLPSPADRAASTVTH